MKENCSCKDLGRAAVQVIESLLDETDQDPHTHYLYAMVSGKAFCVS